MAVPSRRNRGATPRPKDHQSLCCKDDQLDSLPEPLIKCQRPLALMGLAFRTLRRGPISFSDTFTPVLLGAVCPV